MAKEEIMAKEEKFCCAATANSHAGETMSGSSCCDCVKHKYRDVNSKEYKSMIRRLKLIEGQSISTAVWWMISVTVRMK